MKIIYACLIVGTLAGCGDSGSSSDQKPVNNPSVKSQGEGDLNIANSENAKKKTALKLQKGEKGSVYCEHKSNGEAVISLGSFFETTNGLKEEVPLTGLTLTIEDAKTSGAKDAKNVVFNLEDSFPSSPQCTVNSNGIKDTKFDATLQCIDNVERGEWGYVHIKATFSCGM